jgi:tRNA/tmRNA/rRNA uracil-C5-methylase (TrmA/RlmC/RlmD family)
LAGLRAQNPRDGHYTLRAESGPRVFSQTNDAVANVLRDLVVKMIPDGRELLIDAYCGAGFFAKALLPKFDRVIGIDWDKFAIHAAIATATEKENYIAGDVDLELSRALKDAPSPTVMIVDPPAIGLSPNARAAIVDLPPATLIYVSCNPPTLARDLKELGGRFTIESVTPLDMFPQTAEIEVVVKLCYAAA